MTRISVIVPALNEARCIKQTLQALRNLHGDPEIIVVDGGSEDDTVPTARACGVTVISAPRGRGPQMHAGANAAQGDVLWFIHADTTPPPHATSELLRALDDPHVAAGNFRLRFDGNTRAARQLTAIYPHLRRLGLSYGDAGIFVRRSAYQAAGGFQPHPLFEDLDFMRRVKRTGRFVHIDCAITTSARRFENRNFALMWIHWTTLQVLYWAGVPPSHLARWYRNER
jgi:rSAM/selenodomain-associated transferase 2